MVPARPNERLPAAGTCQAARKGPLSPCAAAADAATEERTSIPPSRRAKKRPNVSSAAASRFRDGPACEVWHTFVPLCLGLMRVEEGRGDIICCPNIVAGLGLRTPRTALQECTPETDSRMAIAILCDAVVYSSLHFSLRRHTDLVDVLDRRRVPDEIRHATRRKGDPGVKT
ncbi:hypothetical protein BDP55DRAFT_628509 [Colletotrichum godetiae]|uniref:Uncharacterized protein n=1 Tax=Colletotrichum godetiae TaxID=1209918 RepID=A0AAJ0EZT8_9PEZI|nr:uncharacterized protein BDP55DRAFT_628509 [Colletotrichum godetiae]KAK1689981.1 hypothetical protein BDP55DRAFT_628509 [Colletotrichum godetiae]